jgi:hypothetical protein
MAYCMLVYLVVGKLATLPNLVLVRKRMCPTNNYKELKDFV